MQTFHATLTHIDAAHQRRFAHIDRNIVDVVERLDMLERRTTKHDGQIATYEQVLATAETVEPKMRTCSTTASAEVIPNTIFKHSAFRRLLETWTQHSHLTRFLPREYLFNSPVHTVRGGPEDTKRGKQENDRSRCYDKRWGREEVVSHRCVSRGQLARTQRAEETSSVE